MYGEEIFQLEHLKKLTKTILIITDDMLLVTGCFPLDLLKLEIFQHYLLRLGYVQRYFHVLRYFFLFERLHIKPFKLLL